jgi:ABC-type spermidine/putrescine transport system permease subunit II
MARLVTYSTPSHLPSWEITVNAPENRHSDRDNARWDDADRKLFLITFLGGLSANVGVVLVVAAAIAFDRFEKSRWNLFSYLILIPACIIFGVMVTWITNRTLSKSPAPWIVGVMSLSLSFFLILIAYAAGITK